MVIVAIPAVGLAVLTVAAFLGRWWWLLDVSANFRPQYLIALLVLGMVLMMAKWRRIGLVALVAAALNLVVVLPLFSGSPGESDPTRPALRVISFNIYSPNDRYAEVIEFIQQSNADLVFIHEASRPWEVALEALGDRYRILRPRSEDLIFGTLVLARGTLVEWESYGFATAETRAVSLTLIPEGWSEPVHALSSHPLAPTDAERARLRDTQLGFATEWAGEQSGAFIVVGDLNATPWSWPFRRLEGSTDLRNSAIGFGIQASYPADGNPLLRIPIDHVLHSSALRVRDRRRGLPLGSDHFPVIVDLELAG
jgi:endonuclease/exonuclease/phosphatase (EEP) superfamily protein YafD